MLLIMATAKKKIRHDPKKIGFFGSQSKIAKLHKVLSLARARSQTLGRHCILYVYLKKKFILGVQNF